ncbi:NAD(P)/FAD-dependent oxidoreductase [Pelagibacterium montanilacus]|uniref:NAD(P)/FAD-dependent oxidoreductase n=1 Tax=Pelagibacterium montanilacus TaxID=2185280 RepID=UPI000F8DF963|nr:NAD(P)/FAD-dependent oxidoreductase [Pelagibacterium montanilacus]
MVTRRTLIKSLGAVSVAAPMFSMPSIARGQSAGRVVVVGGGFGGATAAKYLKRQNPALDVTLVEASGRFYTCPFSNLYLGGLRDFESIGHSYDELTDVYGVNLVTDWAEGVDGDAHTVTLASGEVLDYDKLLLSPGVDMRWGAIEGYDESAAQLAPHAWKAGEQTQILKAQLESMDDGGLFILSSPENPFRCPPGPYERVSMIANYFTNNKPNSKILVLDSKDAFSKQGLFEAGWRELYGDMIEWVSLSNDGRVVRVDAENLEVETEFGEVHKADVLNIVPPQKAGAIADAAGVTNEGGWVPIVPETFESQQVPDIYVVGDATVAAPMPKSGFCANSQGKVAAAAIVASLAGQEPPAPSWVNTCYSVLAPDYGISVAGVYHVADGQIAEVADSGGVSPADADSDFRRREAEYAVGWYDAIARDTWGTGA